MVKATNTVEIEISGDRNQAHYFRPLQRRLRGRFDAQLAARNDEGAARLLREWPEPIPGQRVRLDPQTGQAAVVEPLAEPDHAAVAETIRQRGWRIPDGQQFDNVHVATWMYWMASAVQAGCAKVIQGELPADPESVKGAQKSFIVSRQQDPVERLAAAVEKQNELMMQMLSRTQTQ